MDTAQAVKRRSDEAVDRGEAVDVDPAPTDQADLLLQRAFSSIQVNRSK
jgi:hypothetical protein